MQLPDHAPQFLNKEALVVVAAREEGVIYRITNGTIELINELEHHIKPLSDDEGFFFGTTTGGGGAPKERDDKEEYAKTLQKKVAHELDQLIKKEAPKVLYIFEPEYNKGRIEAYMQNHPRVSSYTIRYGNYISEHPLTLVEYITEYLNMEGGNSDSDFDKDLEKHAKQK